MDVVPYLQPIFDDFLYKYDEEHKIWTESYFAIGNHCIFQFESEDEFDDYQSVAYFTQKEYHEHHKRFIHWQLSLYPFDSKTVQKIRPGSGISRRLDREFIFIISNPQFGKYFFATRKQRQFNRWFKNLRRMGARTSMSNASPVNINLNAGNSKSNTNSMQLQTSAGVIKRNSSRSISHSYNYRHSPSNSYSHSQNTGSSQIKNITPFVPKNQNMNKMLEMLEMMQKDIKLCVRDVKYVRKRWIIENDVKRENMGRDVTPPSDTSDGEDISYNYEPRNNKKRNDRQSNVKAFKDRRKNEPQTNNYRSSNSKARVRYRERRKEYSSSGEDFY